MALDGRVETIENGSAAFSFDRGSGALASVRNRVTGNEYLQGTAERGNVFAVYYDFTGEFEITGAERESPHAATLPAAITDSVFAPFQAGTPRFARGGSGDIRTLTVEYDCGDRSAPLRARVGVSLGSDADSSIWSLALTNIGAAPVTCMCSFPLLSGLRLGSGDGNLMVVNDQAGYVLPLWAHSGGTYGNARYMSMQWGCVFDERNRDAFGFIVRDPDIRNKQIRYLEPSIEVSYFPPFSIAPGATVTFPEVEIMVYTGDWKRAAQRYRHWFSRNVGSVRHADWARRIDGHGAGWFEKRGQSNPEGYPHVMLPLDRFEDLPELYHAVPVDCQEYAFHCSRSQPAEITGKRMLWTDADNVIRGDLGGAPALREGIRRIHELGYHFTFYVEGYLCPGDAEIVRRQGAREWAVDEPRRLQLRRVYQGGRESRLRAAAPVHRLRRVAGPSGKDRGAPGAGDRRRRGPARLAGVLWLPLLPSGAPARESVRLQPLAAADAAEGRGGRCARRTRTVCSPRRAAPTSLGAISTALSPSSSSRGASR